MAGQRYLNPDLSYNRADMMCAAWATARVSFAQASAPGRFQRATTLQAEFKDALRRLWDLAKSYRSIALWHAEVAAQAEAETARRAALTANVVAIEDARYALMLAEHNDTVRGHELVVAARVRLTALELAA